MNDHEDSKSITNYLDRYEIYERHHADLENGKLDVFLAKNDIEEHMNESIKDMSMFDYDKFIKRLKEVLRKHASKISEYKKSCDEVWFLIDVGIENKYFLGKNENGGLTKIDDLPITEDMIMLFRSCQDVGRIAVCSRRYGKYRMVYDSLKKYNYKFKKFTYQEACIPYERKIKLDMR